MHFSVVTTPIFSAFNGEDYLNGNLGICVCHLYDIDMNYC